MSDDPTDPYAGMAPADPEIEQLRLGNKLFEHLKNVDTGSAVFRAVNGDALSVADLRAIVVANVFSFRQEADDPDTYAAWSSR